MRTRRWHGKAARRAIGLITGVLALAALQLGPTPASAAPGSILIFGPSMRSDTPNEQTVAEAQGHTVTVASESQWAAMTTAQFAAFDALVIAEEDCDSDETLLNTVLNTRTTWSPAVTGNITLHTFDAIQHEEGEYAEFIANSINFAASPSAGTGLFFGLGCYFEGDGDAQDLTLMDQFGSFVIDGDSGDVINILQPTHPVMSGITNAGLSGWSNSVHQHFVSFPTSFQALAEDTEVDPDRPVVLARTVPPPAPEPLPTCKGKTATVFGDSSDNVLAGTQKADVIAGLEGNDRIKAGGGKDLVCGGEGNDVLRGGTGKDILLGQLGRDLLAGGGGTGDVCKGGPGKDNAKGSCERGRA
jgi:Ca2+-binding RTX toxin-like protein